MPLTLVSRVSCGEDSTSGLDANKTLSSYYTKKSWLREMLALSLKDKTLHRVIHPLSIIVTYVLCIIHYALCIMY